MVKFLVERPVAVLVSVVAFLILGLITSGLLPVSLLPPVDIPAVTIQVSDENLDAGDLESTVISRMRQQLLHVNGLEDIESRTTDGYSRISLKFRYGTDIDFSAMEVNEQVDAMMTWLPEGMSRPRVIKASASDIPVFDLAVAYRAEAEKDFLALSEFAAQILRRRMEQLPSVALADMSGAVFPQVVITPSPEKMKAVGLTTDDLMQAFANHNARLGAVTLRDGRYQYAVNIKAGTHSAESIGNILLRSGERLIRLHQVADVAIEPQPRSGVFLINKREGMVFSVIKNNNARMQDLEAEFETLLQSFRNDYPHLEFSRSRDQTQLLNVSLMNLQQNLVYGFLLAFAMMFIVLGSLRAPFLMGITIPASLIVTLLVFYLAGISVNIVSLSGLILGAGMMIDNSIIVIDNITQYRRRGDSLLTACTAGTNEVIRPLISSVLTTSAVFVPLIFLSDMSGALFYDQAMAIAIGLTVSLLVSIMVIPVLYHLMYQNVDTEKRFLNTRFRMVELYEKGLHYAYPHRKGVFVLFLLLIPAGYFLYQDIQKQLMPDITHTDFKVVADWNEKITTAENQKRCMELYNQVEDKASEVTFFVGNQQFMLSRDRLKNQTSFEMVVSAEAEQIPGLKEKTAHYLRKKYPAASFTVENTRNVFEALFNTSEPLLMLKIRNKNSADLPPADTVKTLRNRHPSLFGSDDQLTEKEVMMMEVHFKKLLLYNVNYNDLIQTLKSELQSNNFSQIPYNQRMIPVVISSESPQIGRILRESFVVNADGVSVPLRDLITLKPRQTYKTLLADEQGIFVPLAVNVENNEVEAALAKAQQAMQQHSGLSYSLSGTWLRSAAMTREMLYVLAVSVLLLFFILAAQFESLIQPLIVLAEVAIDIAGALLLLYLFGLSLNAMSAIGLIVMSGIIINDSIIKVDTVNRLRRQGMAVKEAVYEAGFRRFNPIIMTSLTTILALLPLFFSSGLGVELQLPLAVAVIGGMTLGTFVSLYFIPVFYGLIYDRKQK